MPGTDATHNTKPDPFFDIDPDVLAVATVQRLVSQNYLSSLMKLSRPTLNELGRRLLVPGEEVDDAAVKWLAEHGHNVKRSSIYRFAQRFREVSEIVAAEMTNQYIFARSASDDGFDVEHGYELLERQAVWLASQDIMRTPPGEMKTARLNTYVNMVSAAHKGRLERDKLDLARRQAQDRAVKLEAEVERLTLENDKRRRELQRAIEAAKKDVQTTVEGRADKSMTEDQVIAILDRVMKGESPGSEAA